MGIILVACLTAILSLASYQKVKQKQYLQDLEKLSNEELESLVFKNYPYLEKLPPPTGFPDVPGPNYRWKCGDEEYYDFNHYSRWIIVENIKKSPTEGLTEEFDVLWQRFLLEKAKNNIQLIVIPEYYQPTKDSCKNNLWEKILVEY